MTNWQVLSGLVEYNAALNLMEQQLQRVIAGHAGDTIYLLEHDHVYTAGTNAKDEELRAGASIPVINVGRGGKYTYHGPGQRIIYPIIDLRKANRRQDLKLYVKMLESWIIATLSRFDIECYTIADKVGIWTDIENKDAKYEHQRLSSGRVPAKIGAIGIRVRKWVAYHGIAVNISNDLDMYKDIIPCGIADFPVTSIYSLGKRIAIEKFDEVLKEEYKKLFE